MKAQAAIALQVYLTAKKEASNYIEGQIREITMEILSIIRETENEELTNVMQRIVCVYSNQLVPIAVEVCQHLATTLNQVLETDDGAENRAVTAMGLLNTIETLLSVMSEQPLIVSSLHPIVMNVIGHIFQQSIMDFYEEACSLVYDLTAETIAPDMWQMLELMYQVFQNDGFDYFVDMMPALHNFVTVDTNAFLANPNHLVAMFNMSKALLTGDPGEDPECHAAKLLEVIVLQCKGRIDEAIPSFVDLVLSRLTREVKSSELRTMCLQVVIAALYYNPQLLLTVLAKMQQQQSVTESICSHFIKQWISDTDCFVGIHDRKLCVLGLCTLMSLGNDRPQAINEVAPQLLPSVILLFDGLKHAYQVRAEEADEEEDEDDDDDGGDCEEALSTDEDDIDESSSGYFGTLSKYVKEQGKLQHGLEITSSIRIENGAAADGDEDNDDENDGDDDTEDMDVMGLESYLTTIDDDNNPDTVDEYITFQQVLGGEL